MVWAKEYMKQTCSGWQRESPDKVATLSHILSWLAGLFGHAQKFQMGIYNLHKDRGQALNNLTLYYVPFFKKKVVTMPI